MSTEKDLQQSQFLQLKEVLFKEEIEKVSELETDINNDKRVAKQIEPILEQRIEALQREFPKQFGPVITATLQKQIRESQDEVVEAIYPIMGQLIKKFVQNEVAKLSESIDARMKEMMSVKGILRMLRFGSKGVSASEMLIGESIPPILEEIMVIESESGLLLSNYSIHDDTDADMVAGMMTAIKAFAEDAYDRSNQTLEFIEFERFNLYLQTFRSFYIVVAISGVINQEFKDKLNDAVLKFATRIAEEKRQSEDSSLSMQKLLQHCFDTVNQ